MSFFPPHPEKCRSECLPSPKIEACRRYCREIRHCLLLDKTMKPKTADPTAVPAPAKVCSSTEEEPSKPSSNDIGICRGGIRRKRCDVNGKEKTFFFLFLRLPILVRRGFRCDATHRLPCQKLTRAKKIHTHTHMYVRRPE